MSYEAVRRSLSRWKNQESGSPEQYAELLEALEELAGALEADMTQIKGALSHVAHLLERSTDGR